MTCLTGGEGIGTLRTWQQSWIWVWSKLESTPQTPEFELSTQRRCLYPHIKLVGRLSKDITEIKIHVYRKRQKSDSSWEFLRIENKQIKTVQNDFYG